MIIKYYNENNCCRYRLTHLIDDDVLDDDDFNPPISKDKYFKDISECVIRHQKAIECVIIRFLYLKNFHIIYI